MTDYDRGPYTPPSDRLAFDPREPVRGGGPAPVTLIVSGVVLLALIGGAYWLYRGGVRHHGEPPAAVGSPIEQIKTPAAPAANDAGPRLVVDRSNAETAPAAGAPTFAPAAEQPLPRPLPMAPQPVESQALPPPAAAPAVKPAPAPPVAAIAPTPPASTAAPVRPAASVAALAKPSPSITAPARPSPSIASLTDAALSQRSASRPAPKPAPAAAPVAAVATTAAAPAAGAGWVQIGAYSSADLARKGWSDTARLEPAAMAGKGQRIEALERDGKTLYRAYVTGFSHDGAERFCDELKAAGKACFVK
jgi:hypothetical protein